MLDPHRQRRAPRLEVLQKRQAMAVLIPINDRIGPWQMKTAQLIAYAERLRSHGGYEPSVVAEAEALFSAVSTQQQRLLETARNLPADVASNTRVLDTARALKSVATGLENALELMQQRGRH
jgi:hypothetical protein